MFIRKIPEALKLMKEKLIPLNDRFLKKIEQDGWAKEEIKYMMEITLSVYVQVVVCHTSLKQFE